MTSVIPPEIGGVPPEIENIAHYALGPIGSVRLSVRRRVAADIYWATVRHIADWVEQYPYDFTPGLVIADQLRQQADEAGRPVASC